jgi:hypothetical protein
VRPSATTAGDFLTGPSGRVDNLGIRRSGRPERDTTSGSMHRDPIRRVVLWGVFATLLLPVVLAVVIGLGALLGGLGDAAGSRALLRIGLVVGAAWMIAIVCTTVASAMATLAGGGRHRRRGRRRRRHARESGSPIA